MALLSTIQQLIRAFWGPPGRGSRIQRQKQPRPTPWATDAEGRQAHRGEPLEFPPLSVLKSTTDLQRIYSELVRVSGERESRYKDYEDMILDPTVSGAIELMVDDACQYNREKNATCWVKTEDRKIRKAVEELFDLIQLEERIFDWGFETAMYGDFFMQVQGQESRGVLQVSDDWHPADVQRLDVNGALLGFRTPKSFVETTQMGVVGDSLFWDPWNFVHFKIQASQRRRREIERERMAPMLRFEKSKYRLTTRYGVAVIEAVRRIYKQLQMVEQSMIISRMTRALLKYIYKVHVGEAATVKEAVRTVHEMRDLLTQATGLKLGDSLEQQFSPLSGSQDIFLPVFGERGDVTIDTLGGETNVTGIVDIDYLRSKFFGGLKVPSAYLGFEKDLPGSLGESALLRLDIRYARTVKRVQRAVIQGLTRLTQIHLAYKGLPVDPKGFSIEMDVISTAEEEERKNSLSTALLIAGDLANLNQALRIDMPVKKFAKLVYSDILNFGGKFADLVEEAGELPAEGLVDTRPGVGAPAGGPEELPPEPELPPEGPLEMPPEAEELPPEEGPLGTPGEESVQGGNGRGLLADARREAMESVTAGVRQSSDVRAETPAYDSGHHQKPSRLDRMKRGKLMKVVEGAVKLEQDERLAERGRRKKINEDIAKQWGKVEELVAERS